MEVTAETVMNPVSGRIHFAEEGSFLHSRLINHIAHALAAAQAVLYRIWQQLSEASPSKERVASQHPIVSGADENRLKSSHSGFKMQPRTGTYVFEGWVNAKTQIDAG